MTESSAGPGPGRQGSDPARRCRWCGRNLPERRGAGRPRRYCRAGCRQQAYLARKLAGAHGLGDADVIVDRERLEDLQGRLYCLQAALEDVERDLERSSDPREVAEALAWLQENARPLAEVWIEPRTGAEDPDVRPPGAIAQGAS
ncbi:hypothetical protein [Rhabdothermincola salaria]|uniref:hypothetical protein n=1 Tax=Rhabdothermincola salaria TaxID=2903142 RepID=UPI001E425841|nr:hypothetical protein [Rhabdothermincola salaria]MCD9623095.1 hypothetical protein [Rhabdothermincola salaria]